jgi:hypothetical protein
MIYPMLIDSLKSFRLSKLTITGEGVPTAIEPCVFSCISFRWQIKKAILACGKIMSWIQKWIEAHQSIVII